MLRFAAGRFDCALPGCEKLIMLINTSKYGRPDLKFFLLMLFLDTRRIYGIFEYPALYRTLSIIQIEQVIQRFFITGEIFKISAKLENHFAVPLSLSPNHSRILATTSGAIVSFRLLYCDVAQFTQYCHRS